MIGKDQRPDGPAGSRITVWLRTRFWLRDQGFSPVERLAQRLPPDQLATAAASLSGDAIHEETARAILAGHGLDESALANTPDLPYGVTEREQWLRAGKSETRLAQNCSGKHSAMTATCSVNSWPVDSYLDPDHPLPRRIR